MAIYLEAKTPTAGLSYTWFPPLNDDDGIASGSITVSSGTLTIESTEITGGGVKIFVSGGVAGQTVVLAATVETDLGETLDDTIYLPVIASAAQVADTARSYIEFALRKITGIGETPDADELEDALEQLNALVAMWRAGGADIGAPYPLTAASVIYCPDWAVDALRFNLRLKLASLYGAQIDPMDMEMARRGRQLVMHKNLPAERTVEFY